MKIFYRIALIFVCFLSLFAQTQAQISRYPQKYFMYPIKPGEPTSLTGNMGELRSNHYHGGLDIRTGWAGGVPVIAAADGYVQRVQVDTKGYGYMIFLKHPNGYVTVYAHLQEFAPPLAKVVKDYQYANETFFVDLQLKKNQVTFSKGDTIGLSGNTGGSGGPHLHFEIRDSANNVLNPMLFGFSEIEDDQPPYFGKLAVKTLNINARVSDGFGRAEFYSKRISKHEFVVPKPIKVQGTIGLEVVVRDRINNGSQRAGISCLEMRLDGKEVFYHSLESFAFSESGHINVLIDYEHYWKSGERFQRCYLADGHPQKAGRMAEKMGKITIKDTLPHTLTISAWDAYKNVTHLNVKLQGAKPNASKELPKLVVPTLKPLVKHQLFENTLKINIGRCPSNTMMLHSGNKKHKIELSYVLNKEAVFLWDMRKGLPDSIVFDTLTAHRFYFKQVLPPNKALQMLLGVLHIKSSETALFDTLYLETKHDEGEDVLTVSNPLVPLVSALRLGFKPLKNILNREKTAVYMESYSKKLKYVGGLWEGDVIHFMAKNLGKFRLATDSVPPKIKPAVVNRNAIRVHIYDNMSGIKSFRATLNGQWLLMNYEHKQNLLFAEPRVKGTPLSGELVLQVTDNAGNVGELRRRIF